MTTLQTVRDLILSSSAPNFDAFRSADRDEIVAVIAEIEGDDTPRAQDDVAAMNAGITLDAARAALAAYDAGVDVQVARDEDGAWFALPNPRPVYADAPVLERCDVDCDEDDRSHRYTLVIPSGVTYHVADSEEMFLCTEDGAAVWVFYGEAVVEHHESGDYRATCPRCGTVYVLTEVSQ